MSRPLRIEFPGAWYHVMGRGAGRKNIFRKLEHRILFCDLLSQITNLFEWEVHAYCLMDNHYHLLIRTPLGNLGRCMRHLNGVYTQRFNRDMGTDGPLFRGRYKAILVDADSYLLQVSRYIHRNPLEAGQTRRMGDFVYSSYPFYTRRRKENGWLKSSWVLKMMSGRNARALYEKYVEEAREEDEVRRFYSRKKLSPVLGSEDFLEGIKEMLQKKELSPEISEVREIREAPSINDIQAICAKHFGIAKGEVIRTQRRVSNLPRDIAIYLSRSEGRWNLTQIGAAFDGLSYSGVSRAFGRFESSLKNDKQLSRQIAQLVKIIETKGG